MAYISVNDAVERTGKGQTTIYRFCRKFEHTRHVKREDKKFLIDEEFLSKHLTSNEDDSTFNSGHPQQKPEMVDMFIQELLNEKHYFRLLLDRKDEQLERKDRMIANLQERQKELHYLLNHQTQLLESARIVDTEQNDSMDEPFPGQINGFNSEGYRSKEGVSTDVLYEAKTIYSILAAVGFLLFLAILFVDELKGLLTS